MAAKNTNETPRIAQIIILIVIAIAIIIRLIKKGII